MAGKQAKDVTDGEADAAFDDIGAQLAALTGGMDVGAMGASLPEDKVAKADVDKVIADALASVKQDRAKGKGKGKSKSKGKSDDAEGGDDDNDSASAAAPRFVEGKDSLQAAIRAVRMAVGYDSKGDVGQAAVQYDTALENFAEALRCGVPTSPDAQQKVVESMAGYMDRLQAILLACAPQSDPSAVETSATQVSYTAVNKERVDTLKAIGSFGFSCVARGVALRKRAKAAEDEGEAWKAFILFSEAIDCFVAYMKTDAKGASNKALEKTVLELLDAAEALKATF